MDKRTLAVVVAVGSIGLGLVNLTTVLELARWDLLRSPDLWLPFTGAVTGWLVVCHAGRNAVGWLLLAMGLSSALFGASALLVMAEVDVSAPIRETAAWLSTWVFLPSYLIAFLLLPLLFPDGRVAGRLWRPVLVTSCALVVVETTLLAFGTRESIEPDVPNPLVVPAVATLLERVEPAIWVTMPALALLGVGSLVHRLVRARGHERGQVLSMLTAAGAGVALWLLTGMGLFLALLLPVAITIAVLRFRLYDVQRLLVQTLSYGALAVAAGAVYAATLVTVQRLVDEDLRGQLLGIVLAVLVVHPLRDRLMGWARRLVHGPEHDRFATLAAAGRRTGQAATPAEALDTLADLMRETFGAERVQVTPDDLSSETAAVTRPVVHHGADVGSIQIWRDAPLSPAEAELLDVLTAQVGPALRAHALQEELAGQLDLARRQAEELKASRSRLTQAHDIARREIERNLHDGAQQGLLALSMGLGRLGAQLENGARPLVAELQVVAQQTLEEVRRLASGTYPPALRELGLGPALRDSVGSRVVVRDGLGSRPDPLTEGALYFACLEAVTNALKHADARTITVELARADDGGFRFVVTDDGQGFDALADSHGTGLDGMADRLAARGGSVLVTTEPGGGTTVTGVAYDSPRKTSTA